MAECAAKCGRLPQQLLRVERWWVCSVGCAYQLGRQQQESDLREVIAAGAEVLSSRACACGHADDIHLDLEAACQAPGCECQRFRHWKKAKPGPVPAAEEPHPRG